MWDLLLFLVASLLAGAYVMWKGIMDGVVRRQGKGE